MRISDWSSDVCSSDLITATITPSPFHKDSVNGPNRQIDGPTAAGSEGSAPYTYRWEKIGGNDSIIVHDPTQAQVVLRSSGFGTIDVATLRVLVTDADGAQGKIGRASCRERVCQYV